MSSKEDKAALQNFVGEDKVMNGEISTGRELFLMKGCAFPSLPPSLYVYHSLFTPVAILPPPTGEEYSDVPAKVVQKIEFNVCNTPFQLYIK